MLLDGVGLAHVFGSASCRYLWAGCGNATAFLVLSGSHWRGLGRHQSKNKSEMKLSLPPGR